MWIQITVISNDGSQVEWFDMGNTNIVGSVNQFYTEDKNVYSVAKGKYRIVFASRDSLLNDDYTENDDEFNVTVIIIAKNRTTSKQKISMETTEEIDIRVYHSK